MCGVVVVLSLSLSHMHMHISLACVTCHVLWEGKGRQDFLTCFSICLLMFVYDGLVVFKHDCDRKEGRKAWWRRIVSGACSSGRWAIPTTGLCDG